MMSEWNKNSRNADRRPKCIDNSSFLENNFLTSIDIGSNDREWDFRISKCFFSEIFLEMRHDFSSLDSTMHDVWINKSEKVRITNYLSHLATRESECIKSSYNSSNTCSDNMRWLYTELFESLYDADMGNASSRSTTEYERKSIHVFCKFIEERIFTNIE